MRLQQRNLVQIWYSLYQEEINNIDSDGYEDGQKTIVREPPVPIECNVSTAKGQSQIETFGNLDSYDKIIITDDTTCPIAESTVLFIDNVPDETGKNFDYVVKRIAKSMNSIAYAASKVKVNPK